MASQRRHPLFVATDVGVATCAGPVDAGTPASCLTDAGPVEWATGSLGGCNFAVPCRARVEAGLARWWGLQEGGRGRASSSGALLRPSATAERSAANRFSQLALRQRASDEPASTVNGVVCMAYTDWELAAVEAFYALFRNAQLMRIPGAMLEELSWQRLPAAEWVHCVVIREEAFEPPSFESPIVQSYLDPIIRQFQVYGEDFLLEFLETTRGWSQYFLNDRKIKPGVTNKPAEEYRIDRALKQHVSIERQSMATFPVLNCSGAAEVGPALPVQETIRSGHIKQREVRYFTFGMGSLINTPSRVGTAGAAATCAVPVRVLPSYEFCPCWNFQNRAGGSQLTAGGMVLRDDPRLERGDAEAVGIIYPCPGDDDAIRAQDEREVGYTRYNIDLAHIRSLGWQGIPEGITVFQYVPNTELPDDHPQRERTPAGELTPRAPFATREYPLSQTYVDTCIVGCLEYGREFAQRWIRGFAGWPTAERPFWLNDREMPRRPWVHCPQFQTVDAILLMELPKSMPQRTLPSEYGGHYWPRTAVGAACEPCLQRDVSYSSYSEWSREAAQTKPRESTHFVFQGGNYIVADHYHSFTKGFFPDKRNDVKVIGMPCRLRKAAGLRRSFCLPFAGDPGATWPYLVAVEDAKEARNLNGMLYPLPVGWAGEGGEPPANDDSDKFIWQFNHPTRRVEVEPNQVELLCNYMHLPQGARVFAYVCARPELPTFARPISQRGLDVILSFCLEHVGEDFCQEWVDSTDGWLQPSAPSDSAYWLNDRAIARRPWLALGGKYKVFDRIILESKSPCVPRGALLHRRLQEEYSALAPAVSECHAGSPVRFAQAKIAQADGTGGGGAPAEGGAATCGAPAEGGAPAPPADS